MVVGILSMLLAVAMAAIDPLAQISKGRDAKRLQDITQLTTALDAYFSDKNVYPAAFSFGSQFSVPPACVGGSNGCTIYMKSTPSDPNLVYMSSGGAWAVLFAKESQPNQDCSLTALSSCLPVNYTNYWYCKVLGAPDCTSLQSKTLP